jgi:hypothetical protein
VQNITVLGDDSPTVQRFIANAAFKASRRGIKTHKDDR